MWRHVGLLSIGSCLALGFHTGRARAEPPSKLRVSLEYEVDAGLDCPGADDLRERVVRQLGYSAFVEPGSGQRLRIQISRVSERAQARIEWFDRARNSEGERRLSSTTPGCEELARNLAFAVAVQIQLHAAEQSPASSAPSAPAPPAAALPEPSPQRKDAAPVARRSASSRNTPTWLVGAGGMARSGFSPRIVPGGRAFGAVAIDAALLELSAHASGLSRLRQADGSGFSSYEIGASLAPCFRLPPLGFCAVGTASYLHVRGEGVDLTRSPSSLLAAAGGRVQLLWPKLGRFGLLLAGEVVAILTPRDVSLNESTVWSTAPVAVTLSLNFAGILNDN
jgi:hypothetical protein